MQQRSNYKSTYCKFNSLKEPCQFYFKIKTSNKNVLNLNNRNNFKLAF